MSTLSTLFESAPDLPAVKPDIRVGFILSPSFSLLPFAGFIEGLRHAADEADHSRQDFCTWQIVASSLQPSRASCGVEVRPHKRFPELAEFDYLVVVGGHLPDCLEHDEETLEYLRQAHARNIEIVGLCTGSFVLAKAGLLAGRRCAVHTEHCHAFRVLFPAAEPVADELYVRDGNILTCPGGSSALDLVFMLIEARCGRARATKALNSLLFDKRDCVSYLPSSPYSYLATCGNARVERAYQLMAKHISTPFPIARACEKIGSSERALTRMFSKHAGASPAAVWRNMRLAHGKWLLVNSSKTVTQISLECGFVDNAHFSRWFRRAYDETPRAYRSRRRSRAAHETITRPA